MLKSLLQFSLIVSLFISYGTVAAATTRNRNSDIEYEVFQSAMDPKYSVRFVNPKLCDPNVTQVLHLTFQPFSNVPFFFLSLISKTTT
jgi:hypothetical protein